MKIRFIDRLLGRNIPNASYGHASWLQSVTNGTLYRAASIRNLDVLSNIRAQIDMMRALAEDSQISTALSYYATDATTTNSSGQIIWAVPKTADDKEVADIVNDLFKRWKVNMYARDHILEIATYGNLYLPTTDMYKTIIDEKQVSVALDNNTIVEDDFDIVPSIQIPPEDILHLWKEGQPHGYAYKPEQDQKHNQISTTVLYPEDSIIHFSLGGLIGKYTIELPDQNSDLVSYDIQFAEPMLSRAIQPTRTLSLLEDAMLLSSMLRVIKFINVDCADADEEDIVPILETIKNTIEQQIALNTNTGDMQSFVNPQAPNNLIYLPKVNGQDPISILDLNMAEANETESKLLDYYQNKKLSVLGVPKEALNFSSAEGLGGAGNVMSQRSAIYANSLARLETAYTEGWTSAINAYFTRKGMSGLCDTFILKMNPIVTNLSTINFDKRDSALNQASMLIELMKSIKVKGKSNYAEALTEVLSEVFPELGTNISGWPMSPEDAGDEGGGLDEF